MSQPDNQTEDGLTEAQREEIRGIVRKEVDNGPAIGRRSLLGLLGGAAVVGGASGSGAAEIGDGGGEALSVGSVTASTYQIAGNRYGGPDGAQSELVSELGSSDAGAKYLADDTGALYHWTGSAWELMDGKVGSISAEKAHIGQGEGTTPQQFAPEIVEGEVNVKSHVDNYGPRRNGLNLRRGSRFGYRQLLNWGAGETTTSTSYTTLKSGWFGPLYYPPGTTPVLSVTAKLSNDTAGEENHARLSTWGMDQGETDHGDVQLLCTGTSENILQKEHYLAGPFENYATSDNRSFLMYDIDGKVSAGTMTMHEMQVDMYLEVR